MALKLQIIKLQINEIGRFYEGIRFRKGYIDWKYCKKFLTVPFILEILLYIQTKVFVNIDNGQLGGTHWTSFCINEKKTLYFDSFGGPPENFYLNNDQNQSLFPLIKLKVKK